MPKRNIILIQLLLLFAAYSLFVYTGGTDNGPSKNAVAHLGSKIWQQHNCQSCHRLYGLGGYLGPDLTNLFSQPGKTASYFSAIIQTGGQRMPAFSLSTDEIAALEAYLRHADSSGRSAVPPEAVSRTGNYTIPGTP